MNFKTNIAAGLLVCALTTPPVSAQEVDHAQIDALFAILGTGVAVSDADTQAAPTVAPAPAPAAQTATLQAPGRIPAVPFDPKIPLGEDCPADLPDFEATVAERAKITDDYEDRIIALSTRADQLDAASLEFIMSGRSSCTDHDRENHASFIADAEALAIIDDIRPTEELQVCAQRAVTSLNGQVAAIGDDANREEQSKRLALSNLMSSVARFDGQATQTVQRLVSLEQKRQRLVVQIEDAQAQCAVYENLNLSIGYD